MARKRLKGFLKIENIDAVLNRLLSSVKVSLNIKRVRIAEAVGRVAAEDIYAPREYPPFDRAAVDGYAVRSSDTFSASPTNPALLKCVGTIDTSVIKDYGSMAWSPPTLEEGETYLVFTGAPIPVGADAVVPLEDTVTQGRNVLILKQVPPLANISRKGEDFRRGDTILCRGTIIMPWHVAALAQAGIGYVKVYQPVRVAVINTGDELTEVGSNKPGIINSAGPLIEAYVKLIGCEAVRLGIVRDNVREIREVVEKGLKEADVVVITGGSSVGGRDVVPEALFSIEGAELVFHGVNLRPGRTAGAFIINGKPVLMLSGLPVACYVGLEAILKPLIYHLLGTRPPPKVRVRATLTRRVVNVVGYRSFYRVRVYRGSDGRLYAEPLRLTGSGIISSLIKGNALLIIPEDTEGFDEGVEVEVELIGPIS
ncbi:MAG: molybdopterin molybdotransferase MoeA [Desulfurococcales archaeon]|nr:molybdopterin molybdotransferase MoeA [Desulfurococcales archaeon]